MDEIDHFLMAPVDENTVFLLLFFFKDFSFRILLQVIKAVEQSLNIHGS